MMLGNVASTLVCQQLYMKGRGVDYTHYFIKGRIALQIE